MGIEALADGIYTAQGIEGGVQPNESGKGNPELILDLILETEHGTMQAQTFLSFAPNAAPYSVERLRALGWQGEDLSSLTGIGTNKVKVQKFMQVYEGKQQHKIQIVSGGGRYEAPKPMDLKTFAARVAMIMGKGAAPNAGSSSGVKPPF